MLGGENNRFDCLRLQKLGFLKTWLWSIILRPNCLVCVLFCTGFSLCLHWVFLYCPIKCRRRPWNSNCRNRRNPGRLSSLRAWALAAPLFMPGELILSSGRHFIRNYKQREASLRLFSPKSLTAVIQNREERYLKFQHFDSQFVYIII